MEQIFLKVENNAKIALSLFKPKNSNGKLVIINSATGVRQQIYFKFSEFLTAKAFTVITYDYSGVGLSKPENLKTSSANMRTWGSIDFKTITNYVQKNFPNFEYFCIGHSVGALILGMNPHSIMFKKLIFIGTQKAFVGNLKLKTKIEAYLGFGIAQPVTTKLMGYFPAQWFGLGESLPSGTAMDWRTLILNKKSTNRLLEKLEDYSKTLTQEVFVIRAEDDIWLTKGGVENLLAETYPNLKPTYRLIKTEESEAKKIGHINFFRSYNRSLWDIILKELH